MTSPPLFDFKAGRVDFDETSGEAKPLAGQGRVTLIRSSEDPSLLGVQWLPRGAHNSAAASEELLLVPGDVEFSHVPHCQTGRVIQMRFNSSGERHLYWLQDAPSGDLHELSAGDHHIIERLNELANSMDLEEENDEDAMQDDEAGSAASNTTSNTASNAASNSADAQESVSSQRNIEDARAALSERLRDYQSGNERAASQPLSRLVPPAQRIAHVNAANDEQLRRLLAHTEGLASTRAELCEVVASPYFAQSLDQVAAAAARSPAFARELGLAHPPLTSESLLEQLRKRKQHDA